MIKNYLLIAFRNFIRFKDYSILNIVGLAVGIACFIFISLFVKYELSYDQFHFKRDNIYRIVKDNHIGTPPPLGPACEKEIPEIIKSVRINFLIGSDSRYFSYNNKQYFEKRFILADPSFFEIFTFSFIKGDPKTALNNPNSIVITESTAKKYFNSEDPIGKSMIFENTQNFVVTGVIKDVPDNSHFHFDLVGQFPQNLQDHWGAHNYLTYLLLSDNAIPEEVVEKIGDVYKNNTKQTYNPFIIQKLSDIHLHSHIRGEVGQNGFILNIYMYSIIAFIIMIIACINYINLTTAQYFKRIKEVCIRKVFGANRRKLIAQFMIEALIFITISIDLALLLIINLLPAVNNVLGKQMQISQLNGWSILFSLAGIIVITVILAGSYPALYLSSLNPINIMKGGNTKIIVSSTLKKALLVLQFTISIFFLIFSIIISQQMSFLNKTKLGFNREHIVNIPLGGEVDKRFETLKSELLKYPEVKHLSFNDFLLSGNNWNQNAWWEGLQDNDWNNMMRWIPVDENFVKTFELKIVQGKDSAVNKLEMGYILNESALKYTGLKDPIGKKFNIIGKGTIVGVVEDFHIKSLRDSIVPCALVIAPDERSYMSIRINPGNIPNTIKKIETTWKSIIGDRPFDFFFFDDNYNSLYNEEQRTAKVFRYATILTILISILGLFGLLAITVKQKNKEIAIRKVLGSSISSIFYLLSKDFTKLILLANIISWPIAYYLMRKWLQNFAYRIEISWWIFALAGIVLLTISFITIIWHTWRTASKNPVESLRFE